MGIRICGAQAARVFMQQKKEHASNKKNPPNLAAGSAVDVGDVGAAAAAAAAPEAETELDEKQLKILNRGNAIPLSTLPTRASNLPVATAFAEGEVKK